MIENIKVISTNHPQEDKKELKERMDYMEAARNVIEKGKKLEIGAHTLTADEIQTIIRTCKSFHPSEKFVASLYFNLSKPLPSQLYIIISGIILGDYQGHGESPQELTQQKYVARVLADTYLRTESIEDFIENLRKTDYTVTAPLMIEW